MSGWKKLAAAPAGGGGLDIDEVFSIDQYEGDGTQQTITNGIDLSGEGGLVILKNRDAAFEWQWHDSTASTVWQSLNSNNTNARESESASVNQFNSNGFQVGGTNDFGRSGEKYALWTFRSAPKFFDVQSWTGNGTSGRTVSHNLGSTPGCVIIKRTDGTQYWEVYHNGTTSGKKLVLNSGNAEANGSDITAVSDTTITLSNSFTVNGTSANYVAFIFAHNNGDGGFGPNGDQDIIKCGSYTGDGTTDGSNIVNLGFEPQWLLIKSVSGSGNWILLDTTRGMYLDAQQSTAAGDRAFSPDQTWQESVNVYAWAGPTPNGFALENSFASFNSNGVTYAYIAIRRGSLFPPESASDVFLAKEYGGDSQYSVGFKTDLMIGQTTAVGAGTRVYDRIRPDKKQIFTYSSTGDNTTSYGSSMDLYHDFRMEQFGSSTVPIGWHWKRAPNYFDIVGYSGSSSAQSIDHNLEVEPEMIWVKRRSGSTDWAVYHKDTGTSKYLSLNQNYSAQSFSLFTGTSSTTFSVIGNDNYVNASGSNYIAYLFATLAGVSKVGSYTGNGSSQTIDCGFSSGARFVLIKDYGQSGDWRVWDSVRGIVAGNDPFLRLNVTNAEVTSTDWIDPHNSGFTVNGTGGGPNESSANYIFYAIAT